jgi:hypothetical protein
MATLPCAHHSIVRWPLYRAILTFFLLLSSSLNHRPGARYYYYASVHKSTHWDSAATPVVPFPTEMKELLALSEPLYSFMRRAAIGVAAPSGPKRRRSVADVGDTDLVWVSGRPMTRTNAAISAVDSAVQSGDAVRGCLRVYNGVCPMLAEHLARVAALATAKGYEHVDTVEEMRHAVHRTLAINDVRSDSLVRVVVVRSGVIVSIEAVPESDDDSLSLVLGSEDVVNNAYELGLCVVIGCVCAALALSRSLTQLFCSSPFSSSALILLQGEALVWCVHVCVYMCVCVCVCVCVCACFMFARRQHSQYRVPCGSAASDAGQRLWRHPRTYKQLPRSSTPPWSQLKTWQSVCPQ